MKILYHPFTRILLSTLVILCLLVSAAFAGEIKNPCTTAPYDYQYQDDTRAITINRVQNNNVTYFLVDVQLQSAADFKAGLSGRGMEPVSSIAAENGAVLAINADDFGAHSYGIIVRNSELLRAAQTTRNMLIVDENGDFSLHVDRSKDQPKTMGDTLVKKHARQTFEFGPALVENGQATTFNKAFDVISTKNNRREPRTAIGQIGPLHYVIVVADGRQAGYSDGMTLGELQAIFLECGAQTAMNLDGGGSSELWFQGQVISQPSGGQERSVSDIIYF